MYKIIKKEFLIKQFTVVHHFGHFISKRNKSNFDPQNQYFYLNYFELIKLYLKWDNSNKNYSFSKNDKINL